MQLEIISLSLRNQNYKPRYKLSWTTAAGLIVYDKHYSNAAGTQKL
jgi:hypothetical protein